MHSLPAIDLTGLLSRFHSARPMVNIEPRTIRTGSAGLVEVANGRLDIAFAAVPNQPHPGVSITELVRERIKLACAPKDRFAIRRRVRLAELASRTHRRPARLGQPRKVSTSCSASTD